MNKAEAEEFAEKYSSMSDKFDEQLQGYRREHKDTLDDWQYEVEMEQNVRQIADLQAKLIHDVA